MAGLILWTDIGFHFDNLTREDTTIDLPNDILADERSRNRDRWAIEIGAWQNSSRWLHMASL
jgi:hypothetical protein